MNTAFSHRIDPEPPEEPEPEWNGEGLAREREAALHWVAVFQAAHHPEAVERRYYLTCILPPEPFMLYEFADGQTDIWGPPA